MNKIWKTFGYVWKHGWKKTPFCFALLMAVTLLMSGLMVAGTWITKAVVDALGQAFVSWELLIPMILMLFLKELGLNGSYFGIIPMLESRVRLNAVRALGDRMYRKIGRLSVAAREQEEVQERIGRAERFLDREFSRFQLESTFVLRLAATCLGAALSLAYWSVWFLVITLCLVIPVIFIRLKNNENLYRITQKQQRRKRRNDYLYSLFLDRGALAELSATGAEYPIMNMVECTAKELTEERYIQGQKDGLIQGLSEGVLSFAAFGACVLLAMMRGQDMTVGTFAFLLETIFLLQEELINLGFNLNYFHASALYGMDLVELDAMEDEGTTVDPAEDGGDGKAVSEVAAEVKNLTFSYPGSSGRAVLKNISFTLGNREKIALVGPNGGGKSTLIYLLLGLYVPDCGEIRIYGKPAGQQSDEEKKEKMAAIFQAFLRYETTVKDNIVLGKITEADSEERIEHAARRSTADRFLSGLEAGTDTKVGSIYEGSVNLSGGQWQRLAVARGFFADTPLLFLDEPNAAVDPVAEAELFEHYRNGMKECGGIIVSHRLAALQEVDRILVLVGGEIVEQGTHDQLMEAKGQYYEIYVNQKNWAV